MKSDNKTNLPAKDVYENRSEHPYIGKNNNWWIGSYDTGINARGLRGYTPYIGPNNNWWIDGEDTGKSALASQNAPVRGEDIFNRQ